MQRQSDGFNAMGNIEQLLHRLVRATEGRAAYFSFIALHGKHVLLRWHTRHTPIISAIIV